jgi:tetratricopeptide (TPR) repeat protein
MSGRTTTIGVLIALLAHAAAQQAWSWQSPMDTINGLLKKPRPAGNVERAYELVRSTEGLAPADVEDARTKVGTAFEEEAQAIMLRGLDATDAAPSASDYGRAAKYYAHAAELRPEDSKQLALYGHLLELAGFSRSLSDARNADVSAWGRLFGDVQKLLSTIDPARATRAYAFAMNLLGLAQLDLDTSKAVQFFRDAAERNPAWAFPKMNEALALVELGRYEDALQAYRKATTQWPRNFALRYNHAFLLQRMNRLEEARKEYLAARPYAGEYAHWLWNALGSIDAAQGRFREAEEHYQQALSIRADFVEARHNLALLLLKIRDRRADAYKEFAINREADFLPSMYAEARALLADPARDNENGPALRSRAGELLEKITAAAPGDTEAAQMLAVVYIEDGQLARAEHVLRGALASGAETAGLRELLGRVCALNSDLACAHEEFGKALGLLSDRGTRRRIASALDRLDRSTAGKAR